MKYTEMQKQQIVKLYSDGYRVTDLCSQNHIPHSTLYHWIHQYGEVKASNGEIITAHHLYLLKKRIQRLTVENEIWKKCNCTINSPLSQKLESIEKLYQEYGIHACCRVLKVRRSTFYHYLFRRTEQTLIQKEDEVLKPAIRIIFEEAKGRLGSKKIRILLMSQGYTASSERVSRLMKEMNFICVSQKKGIKYNFSEKGIYRSNELNQQFEQSEPNRVWVSDITRLYVNYKPYYMCVIIDLFSRKVVAYRIANNQETPIVIDSFIEAYEKRNCPADLLFHSDQGSQYSSFAFRKLLRKKKIRQSFSNPGCPYDNAVAESFFRTLKTEEVSQTFYATLEQLKASIDEYIRFFNTKRPHQKMKYLTPNQVEEAYFSAQE